MADRADVRAYAGGGRSSGPTTAVVLAVILALLSGAAIGRLTAPDRRSGGSRATPRRDLGPGPYASDSGVPVSYARTPAGVVAALVNYSVVLSGLVFKPDAQRATALNAMGTPRFAADTAARLQRARA